FVLVLGATGMILIVLSNFEFFKLWVEIVTDRFESSTTGEGGVEGVFYGRFLGDMVKFFSYSQNIPFWGVGLGAGTNAGAAILTGSAEFSMSEGEWGRLMGEMGLFMGALVIAIRGMLAFNLIARAVPAMVRKNFMPWMLLSFSFLLLFQGQ